MVVHVLLRIRVRPAVGLSANHLAEVMMMDVDKIRVQGSYDAVRISTELGVAIQMISNARCRAADSFDQERLGKIENQLIDFRNAFMERIWGQ